MKNKKKIMIIVLLVILIAVVLFVFFKSKRNNITFLLNGNETMVVEYGSNYIDPGVIAKDGYGNNIDNSVTIVGNVNTFISGTYRIDYELKYNDKRYNLFRIVTVKNINLNDLKIVINGGETTYVLKDTHYEDSGAYVLNTLNNSKFEYVPLNVSGEVNTSDIGNYEIIYTLNYNGGIINAIRTVKVIDIKYNLLPEELTSNKVKILLDLDDLVDYSNVILPDGNSSSNKTIEYEVSSNGIYSFRIKLNNEQEFVKNIEIDNILSKNYICTGEITTTGTKLNVTPTSDIKEYEWIIGNESIRGTNSYSKGKIINNAKVNLTFSNNKKYQITCNISDKLVYHFKYDENNTKPYMKCDTYTAQDKIKLDAQLKQVVEEAGYGTRAGVVAAARFLVGGLDYKVKYLGPKEVNKALGRYKKEGLNIGQTGAWGCSVSGYTQGMDCTNFIEWAFAQNGIDSFPYSTKHSKVKEVVDQIRVGDLLYSPCTSSTCKNAWKINHVSIIIGIDDNYFYVAESTTGNINAIVVTKKDKKNLSSSSSSSLVHFFDYGGEGNVTDMWMSE